MLGSAEGAFDGARRRVRGADIGGAGDRWGRTGGGFELAEQPPQESAERIRWRGWALGVGAEYGQDAGHDVEQRHPR